MGSWVNGNWRLRGRVAEFNPVRGDGVRQRLGLTFRGGLVANLFVLPSIVFICVFIILPILGGLYYSFTTYDLLTAPKLSGFDNYRAISTEPRFPPAVRKPCCLPWARSLRGC